MELKSKKYIKNTGRYPKYFLGTASLIASLVARNVQGGLEYANMNVADSDQITSGQKVSQGNIGGISYDKIDENIDEDTYLSQYGGAAAGSDFASLNFVGGFSKLFGNKKQKQKEQLALAKERIKNINKANYLDAVQTAAVNDSEQRKQEREQYGYEYAYNGRAPRRNNKQGRKTLVDTAYGKMPGKQNAWVNKGERIIDTLTGMEHQVKRGPGDTAPAYLTGKDAVLSASKRKDLVNPETGNSFAEDYPSYKAAGQLGRLLALNSMVHQNMNNKQKYEKAYGGRSQRYPHFYGGTYTVKQGDTMWDLAKQYTGDPKNYTQLVSANPKYGNGHWIYPGNVLNLPEGWGATTPAESKGDGGVGGKGDFTGLSEIKPVELSTPQATPGFSIPDLSDSHAIVPKGYDTSKYTPKDNNFRDKDQLLSPWMSIIPAGLQAAGTISAAMNLRNQPTSNINSYRENAYGRYALDQLGKLRANAQPALNSLDRAYAAQSNDIDRNVSLTTGQKLAHKLAASNSINNQRSKILADYQNMNNQYKSNWANAMMQYGQQEANNKMSAYQYDTRYNDQARAAKRAMEDNYRKELSSNLGSLAKNLINTYLSNKTYNRYAG